ncbi:MAG: permease [Limnochordaceae bacterium]|uniref:Permease n=1 Tax=Carboxydichorda subterranea TaxID=3109565 RepID=A0ABZ1C016_9FIRM|nr:permease [Limnochorda sp. L945t]MBE3598348.1 permease [Limnochordaceae bacterium]WRP18121.1 permease [Limnochorda sp. L945t]
MIGQLLLAGLRALEEYVALHVLTCLVPAFLLAGAMVSLVSKEAIAAYLGSATHRLRSFVASAIGSVFVAACSCTVIPVASGLYYGGAGIGAAFIVLWVAPAANVLALSYTASVLGGSMAVVRLVAAMSTALVVGFVMTWAFWRSEAARAAGTEPAATLDPPGESAPAPGLGAFADRAGIVLMALLAISLLAPNYLVRTGPYWVKVSVWAVPMSAAFAWARWRLERERWSAWLHETWWFVRLIVPTLLAGVFAVGVIAALLPPEWVQRWLGGSGLGASFAATLIGAVSYFATMTEAPFVARLMELGMGKGPALGLLLAGPGLSLPSMLTIGRVFGARKATVYVAVTVALATAWAWAAGNWLF